MGFSRRKVKSFLASYETEYAQGADLPRQIEKFLKEVLVDTKVEIHSINCRYKSPESALIKCFEKKYKNPRGKLTDKIGARIITLYEEDTYKVEQILRKQLIVDERNSGDKSDKLGIIEFGYKSIHVVGKLKDEWVVEIKYPQLKRLKFEIQVRSIFSHMWAEIEHEIVYKAGVEYPEDFKRKFAILASTLELVESQFKNLNKVKFELVEKYVQNLKANDDLKGPLDTAKMIAIFEVDYPNLIGWRKAAVDSLFEEKSDFKCIKAMRSAAISTPKKLRGILKSKKFKGAVQRLRNRGEPITHLTLAHLAIALKDKYIFRDYYRDSKLIDLLSL